MNHLKVELRGACSVKGGTYHLKVGLRGARTI